MRIGLLLYVLKRVFVSIPILIGVSIIAFSLIHLIPGDPIDVIVAQAEYLPPERKAEIRSNLGLDQPLWVQYWDWFTGMLTGDMGHSYIAETSVNSRIADTIWPTVHIGVTAVFFAVLFALPIGILSAIYKDTWVDQASRFFAFGGVSIPRFWLGLMLMLVFAESWNTWFGWSLISTGGWVPLSEDPVQWARHVVAPALCIGLGYTAMTTRIARGSMIEELNKDYVTTARSKGAKEQLVVGVHVVRNALIPVVTVIGMQLGFIFSGVVVVEEVFAIPGLGRLLFDSVRLQDVPTVQALLVLIAGVYITVNLLVDISYAYLDPRITYTGEQ